VELALELQYINTRWSAVHLTFLCFIIILLLSKSLARKMDSNGQVMPGQVPSPYPNPQYMPHPVAAGMRPYSANSQGQPMPNHAMPMPNNGIPPFPNGGMNGR
jgi:hypothetical protein